MRKRTYGLWLAAVASAAVGGAEALAKQQQSAAQQPGATQQPGAQPAPGECRESAQVSFGLNSVRADGASAELDEAAAWLESDPKHTVVINAFTDPSGNARYNEDLSFRRAQSVAKGLIDRGGDSDRIIAVGQGEATGVAEAAPASTSAADQRTAVVMLCMAPDTGAAPTGGGATSGSAAAQVTPPAEAPPSDVPPAAAPAEGPPAEEPVGPVAQASPEDMGATSGAYGEPPVVSAEVIPQQTTFQRAGLGVALGGGITGFTDDEARDLTSDVGGSWDVRVILGARLPVALELAYIGSATSLEVAGIESDSTVVGNGLESVLRVQAPLKLLRPYLLAGVGWTNYQLSNEGANVGQLADSDNLMTFPLGVGLTVRVPFGMTVDVRSMLRLAYGSDLMNGVYENTGAEAHLHTWGVDARLGWEF
jgi:outer membrane protein OmpA-like peptidoglycan-associated protein